MFDYSTEDSIKIKKLLSAKIKDRPMGLWKRDSADERSSSSGSAMSLFGGRSANSSSSTLSRSKLFIQNYMNCELEDWKIVAFHTSSKSHYSAASLTTCFSYEKRGLGYIGFVILTCRVADPCPSGRRRRCCTRPCRRRRTRPSV